MQYEIVHDEMVDSPRYEFDCVTKMVCWSKKYNLGDRHDFRTPEDFIDEWFEENEDQIVAMQPLYLYDHSGLHIATKLGSVDPQWDWSQVGWIYITTDAMKRFGVKDAKAVIRNEIEIYNQYLAGDVWGVIWKDENGETVDSLWGIYGKEYAEETAEKGM